MGGGRYAPPPPFHMSIWNIRTCLSPGKEKVRAGLLRKGIWDLPPQHHRKEDFNRARVFTTMLLSKEPRYPLEQGELSSLLISSGLEGGSKNQPQRMWSLPGVWVPHPEPLSAGLVTLQSQPGGSLETTSLIKGACFSPSVAVEHQDTLCVVFFKMPFLVCYPFPAQIARRPFPTVLQLPFWPISFLGVMAQDPPPKSPSMMHWRRQQSPCILFFFSLLFPFLLK